MNCNIKISQHPNSHDVNIFYFCLDDRPRERERLYLLLSDDEKQRASRYRFDVHRHRFISSRGKLREILAVNSECRPEEINFGSGEYGKPYIRSPVGLRHIHFNASASGPIGAVAISTSTSLGFDLEKITNGEERDFDLIIKNECTNEEYDWYMRCLDKTERNQAFYALWTCKEAYLKALGVGLNNELAGFSVNFVGDRPFISYTRLEDNNKSDLFLYQMKITDGSIACLALAKADCNIKTILY